ncbi:hypothetical protein BaRGS_00016238 [Batillaria attramentaria]|uniref:Large ribosomal subunit protein bL34m n=1 Tax=Batillaria attramentaria TaxID=370345 RepID=A0ABD0KZC6_9CAEN
MAVTPIRLTAVCQRLAPLSTAPNFSSSACPQSTVLGARSCGSSSAAISGRCTDLHKSAPLLHPAAPSLTQCRGRAEIYYQPSAWKRINKHGIHRKLQTPGGIEVLWRRLLKGRHSLAPYERILTLPTYNGQILPDHHLKYNQHLVNKELLKMFPKGIPQKQKQKKRR